MCIATAGYIIKTMKKDEKEKKQNDSPAAQLGRLGGKAYVKKYGKKSMKALGKLGAEKRWGKKEE